MTVALFVAASDISHPQHRPLLFLAGLAFPPLYFHKGGVKDHSPNLLSGPPILETIYFCPSQA